MMYSFKEKNKYLKELLNPTYCEADIILLRKVDPSNQLLKSAESNPNRNSEKILYTLLGLTTREEIRTNRRVADMNAANPITNATLDETQEQSNDTSLQLDKDTEQDSTEQANDTSNEDKTLIDEISTELEDTKEILEETQEQLEDITQQLDDTTKELKKEKKSPKIKKSTKKAKDKKKKSTP